MSAPLLPVVGPDSPETHSILTIQKAKLKDQYLTCEFTEQRDEESPARAFAVTCQETPTYPTSSAAWCRTSACSPSS